MDQNLKNLIKQRARAAGQQLADAMHILDNHVESSVDISPTLLGGKSVVKIVNSSDSVFRVVPDGNRKKLTKLFLNGCVGCKLELDDSLLTQHLEMIHCEGMEVFIRSKLYTLQLDLCSDVVVHYDEDLFCESTKIIHAGVRSLSVSTKEGHGVEMSYKSLTEKEDHVVEGDESLALEERQFMTVLNEEGFATKRVVKRDGDLIPSAVNI